MTKRQLLKKLAYLESINDQLSTEISYVDQMMKMIGFAKGLSTLKATAEAMIERGYIKSPLVDEVD